MKRQDGIPRPVGGQGLAFRPRRKMPAGRLPIGRRVPTRGANLPHKKIIAACEETGEL